MSSLVLCIKSLWNEKEKAVISVLKRHLVSFKTDLSGTEKNPYNYSSRKNYVWSGVIRQMDPNTSAFLGWDLLLGKLL